jgi:hypothetical protein
MIRRPALSDRSGIALLLRRSRPAALALLLALLGHAALLAQWRLPPISVGEGPAQAALALRVVTVPSEPMAPSPVPSAAPASMRRQPPHPRQNQPSTPSTQPLAAQAETPARVAALHPLPPQRWAYRLVERGQQGQALLHWHIDEDSGRYTLRLERTLPGRTTTAWLSSGRVDAVAGLQPERFATLRQGREQQATNFRREQGLLSYSASTALLPLPAGVQDRLSLWLQLAALAQGRHPLHAGLAMAIPVAGLRGAELPHWRFVVETAEPLAVPGSDTPISAWRLAGSPEQMPEQRLELWLAPALHYLPVRLRWSWEGQERSELLLLFDAQP